MPVLITDDLKGKELYFDLRPNGIGEAEGFWAVPLFESDRRSVVQSLTAKGQSESVWIELLVFCIKRWVGFTDMHGKDIPCTAENIRKLCDSDGSTMLRIFNKILEAGTAGTVIAEKN